MGENSTTEIELQLKSLNENVAHLAELLQELIEVVAAKPRPATPPPIEPCTDGKHGWVQQSYMLRPDGTITDSRSVICKYCGRVATHREEAADA